MNNSRLLLFILTSTLFIACKHDVDSSGDDELLYNSALGNDFIYYQNGDLLNPASPSPHGTFKLRFNALAAAALDTATGELAMGNSFPTGSVIVKEIISNGNINQLAVMKKAPTNPNAGSGWLWGEYSTTGEVDFSISKKGVGCIGCHSSSANRDLVATFDLH